MTSTSKLRDYQVDQYNACMSAIASNQNIIIQSPTGTGKSVVIEVLICSLIEQGYNRILVITPNSLLVDNIADQFNPRLVAKAYSGVKPNLKKPILVSTFLSVGKYIQDFDPEIIISDETHYSASKTWSAVLTQTKALKIGFTATPERLDGKSLEDFYDTIYVSPSIKDFIDKGYLSPIRMILSDVAPQIAPDSSLNKQEKVIGSIPEIEKTVKTYLNLNLIGKTLVFVTGKKHGKLLETEFKKYGVRAVFIYSGQTYQDLGVTKSDRRNTGMKPVDIIIDKFRTTDEIDVLINIDLCTTGVNIPDIQNILMCRKTQSKALFYQMVGRGTRLAKGKECMMLIDLVGNVWQHSSEKSFLEYTDWKLETIELEQSEPKEGKDQGLYCEVCDEKIGKKPINQDIKITCPRCGHENFFDVKEKEETDFNLLDFGDINPSILFPIYEILKNNNIPKHRKIDHIANHIATWEIDNQFSSKVSLVKQLLTGIMDAKIVNRYFD